jgi:hypothetical protein
MRRLSGVLLLCAPALLGCGWRQPGAGVAGERSAARPVSVAPPAAAIEGPGIAACRCAANKSRAAIERARQLASDRAAKLGMTLGSAEGMPELPGVEASVPDLPCWPNGTTAWAVTLAEATLCPVTEKESDQFGWHVAHEFHLSHFTSGACEGDHTELAWHVGTEDWSGDQRFSRRGELCAVHAHPFYPQTLPIRFFDFDRDGDPEIWIGIRLKYEGDTAHLYTFKRGKIESYPVVGHEFGSMEDVTGDGRPDFLWTDPLAGTIDCGDDPYDVRTPGFLAHSLPDGSFSVVSAEARRHAQGWCPSPPALLQHSQDVVCARLWGADTASLVRRIQAELTPYECNVAHAQQPNGASDYHAMLAAAKYEPPFRLSR